MALHLFNLADGRGFSVPDPHHRFQPWFDPNCKRFFFVRSDRTIGVVELAALQENTPSASAAGPTPPASAAADTCSSTSVVAVARLNTKKARRAEFESALAPIKVTKAELVL